MVVMGMVRARYIKERPRENVRRTCCKRLVSLSCRATMGVHYVFVRDVAAIMAIQGVS